MGRESREREASEIAELERTMGPVRDFNATAECDKCGLTTEHPQFMRRFCSGRSLLGNDNGRSCFQVGEHLHCVCPRCQYGWFEHCKDHKKDEPEPVNWSAEVDASVGTTVTPQIRSNLE